jgi:hypothetical protein
MPFTKTNVTHKQVNGELVEIPEDEKQAIVDQWNAQEVSAQSTQWKYERVTSYGTVGDQLDMMYWDSVNGSRTWLDHVEAVKEAHPKP